MITNGQHCLVLRLKVNVRLNDDDLPKDFARVDFYHVLPRNRFEVDEVIPTVYNVGRRYKEKFPLTCFYYGQMKEDKNNNFFIECSAHQPTLDGFVVESFKRNFSERFESF